MAHIVTVLGAGGRVGKLVAERLLGSGVAVRAVGRGADRLAPLAAAGAEPRVGDIQDAAFLSDAFRGADAIMAMMPQDLTSADYWATQDRMLESLAEAVKTAGVRRVVALVTIGADLRIGPGARHHALEETLAGSPGLGVVVLRSAFLMENHLASIPLIQQAGINGSAIRGDVSLPMVAARDVAAVAADYLRTVAFDGFTLRELLGPRDYSHREATAILGAAIGKPDLAYVEFPYDAVRGSLIGAGFSADAADALVELQAAFNDGRWQSTISRSQANSTPTTLEEFAREVFAPAYGRVALAGRESA